MDFSFFHAGKDDDGRRLDRILKRLMPSANLSSIYKSLRKGLVKVNGGKADASMKISFGDEIKIAEFLLSQDSDCSKKSSPLPVEMILFRNEHLLVLNKPYGIPVQPGACKSVESLSDIVSADFSAKNGKKSLSFRPGPLHRLDRNTTGLVVFSQSIDGARIFSEWIKNHLLEKIYLGLVLGCMEDEAVWVDKIMKNQGNGQEFRTVSVLEKESRVGKTADTKAIPLAHGNLFGNDVTLVKFLIGSGRTHQIRSQAASHGFPLLGDGAYGGKVETADLGQEFFLHARELSFPDCAERNFLGLPEKLLCPLPENFEKILNKMLKKSFSTLIF